MTRGEFAAMTARILDLQERGVDPFEDDDGHRFERDIELIAHAGITKGCDPPANRRFCPDRPITRGEVSAFVRRSVAG